MKYLVLILALISTSACSGKAVAVGGAALIGGVAGAQINEDFGVAPVKKGE